MEMQMEHFTTTTLKKLRIEALHRVLLKIDKLISEASFENTRWIFDWDTSKAPIHNIDACNAELDVLNSLQNEKIVVLRSEPTPDISDAYGKIVKHYREPKDYIISETLSYVPSEDIAGRHYHTAIWLTDFDIDRFRDFCNRQKIDLSNKGILCELVLDSIVPVLTIGANNYRFTALQDGRTPFKLINAALNKCERQGLDSITLQSNELETSFKNKSLTQILKDSHFKEGGLLAEFIPNRSKHSITFTRKAYLTESKIQKIESEVKLA